MNSRVDSPISGNLLDVFLEIKIFSSLLIIINGARGVMVIDVGNGRDDTSSNPGRDWLHFT